MYSDSHELSQSFLRTTGTHQEHRIHKQGHGTGGLSTGSATGPVGISVALDNVMSRALCTRTNTPFNTLHGQGPTGSACHMPHKMLQHGPTRLSRVSKVLAQPLWRTGSGESRLAHTTESRRRSCTEKTYQHSSLVTQSDQALAEAGVSSSRHTHGTRP